ncbi:MAG: SAM-dependent methyltransferase [Pseudomonadota bacterium]
MSLRDILISRIKTAGPLTVADYMADCLLHPRYGYYTTQDPFGAAGDFITAPEVSQMFGELLGLCLAQTWLDQGRPAPITLAELGPGRGTLMADVLRATKGVPGFHGAVQIHLVEASPKLRDLQRQTLDRHSVTWCDHVGDLPMAPLLLLANEFLDALPIRQFVRDGGGWRERVVALHSDDLAFSLTPATPRPDLAHVSVPDGTMVERCPALPAIMDHIGTRVALGGAALIIDYGHWRSQGDTLQAVRAHRFDDVLAAPGTADLTAHVDFEAVAQTAAPARASAMVTQGVLLERLGIGARAQALGSRLSGSALDSHLAAHRRLTHPSEMGDLFKAIALTPEGADLPPGFDP